ncbi:hypothetical protein [Microbacterium sp. NIBRBAC000506063]|uniref:hypothetical protein n=1 Tax=Microbacterium sp. NIBRBAC000506063 TaxID=2734618 RepID=UPI001CB734ED|nr:hypothetical protein [Microbacterium sp. NIBRBAC000506063]
MTPDGTRAATSPRRAAMASFIGTALEHYDFLLYGYVAALVFGQLFFPTEDPAVSTIVSFAAFAVGFIARPSAASSPGTSAIASAASRS